jgi:hypothetical protein
MGRLQSPRTPARAHALVSPRSVHDQRRCRALAPPPVKVAEPGRPEGVPGRESFAVNTWRDIIPGSG